MTLDHFNNLTDDEKAAALQSFEAQETLLKDHEAEIASLKKENETFKAGTEKLEKELKETKELNFTLARNAGKSENKPTFEDTLHSMFNIKKGENS